MNSSLYGLGRSSSEVRRLSVAGLCLSALLVLTGCADSGGDGLAGRFPDGGNVEYVSEDGSVKEYLPGNRKSVEQFGGPLDQGGFFESDSLLGDVSVINFWYAGCPPCRVEAKDLESVHQEFLDEGVSFVGVNVRDTAPTALAFAETFGTTFPSILDVDEARGQLAFAGIVPANAVPTTLVLDSDNRVAARILGIVDPSILRSIVSSLLSESR